MHRCKIVALALAVVMGFSSLCYADEEQIPEGAEEISAEEYAYIEGELENGRTCEEIASDLTYGAAASISNYTSVTWFKQSGKWYCKDSAGKLIKGFARISGTVYYMNSSGAMLTGWQQISGTWYYFASSGAMKTGWQKISKKWYYFNSNGEMLTGLQSIGGSYYIFNSSGAMATGWKQYENKWYYLNSSGAAKTSTWYKSGSTWYYFGSDGVMATGSVSIGGKYYLFNGSGAMLTGWQKYSGEWYYLASSGAAYTGWIVYRGQDYFLDAKGMMLHDTEVGGKILDSDGHIVPEPQPADTGKFKEDVEDELVGLINNLRKTAAVERQRAYYVPIQMRSTERTMAQTRAKELVANFSHASASGTNLADECIYKGSASSASAIFGAWKNSGSHKSSMCSGATSSSRSVIYCGIGVWYYNGVAYAVFGTKGYESGTGLPSGYIPPEEGTPSAATQAYDAGEYSINNTHTGEGTFYDRTSTGAANLDDYESIYYTAAMNTADYMNNLAGAYIEITDKDGDKINVLITDRLPEGAKGDIDLTRTSFSQIEALVTGRMNITWKIIPLPTNDPVSFVWKPTSSQYWAEVQVRNHRYPIKTVEYKNASGNYVALERQEYNYFTAPSGMGKGPFTFRITDIYGHQIVETGIAMNSTGTPVAGQHNFDY